MDLPKLCRDCKWKGEMGNRDYRCNHPHGALIDPVRGHPLCEDMRMAGIVRYPSELILRQAGPCGPEGKLWEARK